MPLPLVDPPDEEVQEGGAVGFRPLRANTWVIEDWTARPRAEVQEYEPLPPGGWEGSVTVARREGEAGGEGGGLARLEEEGRVGGGGKGRTGGGGEEEVVLGVGGGGGGKGTVAGEQQS